MGTFAGNIISFLSVLGPSVITTMAGNDGGGVITYSLSGAILGYAILFTLPALTILYGVTQEMGSRIAIATGKGLGDLIRERFGIRVAIIVSVLLLIANFGSVLTNISAVKVAADMFHIPSIPLIAATVAISFIVITQFSYEKSQKLFLLGMFFYFAYVFSTIVSHPDYALAIKSMFVPPKNLFSPQYIIVAIAVLGTTITPWGQFFVQSYMKDKKTPPEKMGYAKLEAYIGAFTSNFFTFFIMLATASTLFVNNIPLESGEQAALAIQPFAGQLASILFALGLINAAIIGMVIVSLSSSYAFVEFFGFQGSLDDPFQKSKTFYTVFIFTLIVASLIVITPYVSLFKIVLYTQSLNAILLPIFFFFIYKITNDKSIMGKFTNGRINNYIAIVSSVVIVLASCAAVYFSLFGS